MQQEYKILSSDLVATTKKNKIGGLTKWTPYDIIRVDKRKGVVTYEKSTEVTKGLSNKLKTEYGKKIKRKKRGFYYGKENDKKRNVRND